MPAVWPRTETVSPERETFADLSIVVPLYNEEESLPLLDQEIRAALQPMGLDYEVVYVDDGSRDGTLATARDLARTDPRLVVIALRRNYGQTPALQAGIDHTRGRIVISMDGDLQNDPADIPLFLNKMDEGFDVVRSV